MGDTLAPFFHTAPSKEYIFKKILKNRKIGTGKGGQGNPKSKEGRGDIRIGKVHNPKESKENKRRERKKRRIEK